MVPRVDTELELQFALGASAWWLLLLVPIIAAIGWGLYRRQWKGLERVHVIGLVALRLFLLVALVFLAFRPSLVYRTVLEYPGRVLVVVDNSESMRTTNAGLADGPACRLARAIAAESQDQSETYRRLARMLLDVEADVRQYERFLKKSPPDDDTRWDVAARTQDALMDRFDGFAEAVAGAPAPPERLRSRLKETTGSVAALSRSLQTLFSVSVRPDAAAFDRFCSSLESDADALAEIQTAMDVASLNAGNAPLAEAASDVRGRSRLDVVAAYLEKMRARLADRLRGQGVEVVTLITGEASPLDSHTASAIAPERGLTDIAGRLDAIIEDESDFPLSAVAVFTDGRDIGEESMEAITQAYSRAQVPVFACGIGGLDEPTDLAILRVVAPPFAVVGAPMNVRALVKTSLPEPTEVAVQVLRDGESVAKKNVTLGTWDDEHVLLRVTPKSVGHARYQVRVSTVKGEAFPAANNAAEFVTHVRAERVRVLMLDWKPRWETRFALNTLRRLDYIDLNAIVVIAGEKAALTRGVARGNWPSTRDELSIYDLVVIGDVPDGLLTDSDWEALRLFAEEQGKTLCYIGERAGLPGLADARACRPDAAATPLLPPRLAPGDATPELTRLSAAGAIHPLTRRFARGIEEARIEANGWAFPRTHALMTAATGAPLVAARFVGNGKVVSVRSDQLWKVFNPTHLDAHAQLFVGLIEWAVDGGFGKGEGDANRPIALETRALTTCQACQVWLDSASVAPGTEAHVEAVAAGKAIASSPAAAQRDGAGVLRASFDSLPAGDVSFRVRGGDGAASDPILVVDDYPELRILARDQDYLRRLAQSTGGSYRELPDAERFFLDLELKERVQKHESTWRLWDSAIVWGLLALALTAEWVWRKLVGLV